MNYPTLTQTAPRRRLTAMVPVPRTQAFADPTPHCRMTAAAEAISSTVAPAVAGVFWATFAQSDIGVITGAAVAGAGVAGVLGLLFSDSIPEFAIQKLTGWRRLAANWLTGLCSIPFISPIKKAYFPDEDMGLVAAGVAGAFSLFGVLIIAILIPMLVKAGRNRAQQKLGIPDEPRMLIPSRPQTDTSSAETKRLVP